MDVKPAKTFNAGQPGYRAPQTRGTIDVWHGQQRHIFTKPRGPRKLWKEAAARYILGPGGRAADLIRLVHSRISGSVGDSYAIGPLKKQGAQAPAARRPGDGPAHVPAGLELVRIIQRGTPEWETTSGPPRGCLLAFDGMAGPCYVFHATARPSDRLAIAWQYSHGPRPDVRKLARHVYLVNARTWTPAEITEHYSIRAKAAHFRVNKSGAAARAARVAKAEADRAAKADRSRARDIIATAARAVDSVALSYKTAAARAASGLISRAEADHVRARLALRWRDYADAVAAQSGILAGQARPWARPACRPGGSMPGAGRLGGPNGEPVTYGM